MDTSKTTYAFGIRKGKQYKYNHCIDNNDNSSFNYYQFSGMYRCLFQ